MLKFLHKLSSFVFLSVQTSLAFHLSLHPPNGCPQFISLCSSILQWQPPCWVQVQALSFNCRFVNIFRSVCFRNDNCKAMFFFSNILFSQLSDCIFFSTSSGKENCKHEFLFIFFMFGKVRTFNYWIKLCVVLIIFIPSFSRHCTLSCDAGLQLLKQLKKYSKKCTLSPFLGFSIICI